MKRQYAEGLSIMVDRWIQPKRVIRRFSYSDVPSSPNYWDRGPEAITS